MAASTLLPVYAAGARHMRASALNTLRTCPGLLVFQSHTDTAGRAAQTGSAVGRVLELWHGGVAPEEAYRQCQAEGEQWPAADWDDVLGWASAYVLDPRNGPNPPGYYGAVVPGSCEREVSVELPCSEDDPTGQPVRLVGHLDQLRRGRDGVLRVWDVKSGKDGGIEMLANYAWQLSAYAVASTATLGEPVWVGGVIRLRGYRESIKDAAKVSEAVARAACTGSAPVFFEAGWSLDDARVMLDSALHEIAQLRKGAVVLRPGAHCGYCGARPFADCWKRIPAEEVLS